MVVLSVMVGQERLIFVLVCIFAIIKFLLTVLYYTITSKFSDVCLLFSNDTLTLT